MSHRKKKSWILKISIIIAIAIVLIAAACLVYLCSSKKSEENIQQVISAEIVGETKEAEIVFTQSQLEKVLEINELYTANYTYNSIVTVYDDDNETVKYHVSYEGVVKAGIDFHNIKVTIDRNKKLITVKVPEASVIDKNVDPDMDFIFTKDKYNTATVASDAYDLCCKDLEEKAEKETYILDAARENAISAVKALIEPWVEQVDSSYAVSVE